VTKTYKNNSATTHHKQQSFITAGTFSVTSHISEVKVQLLQHAHVLTTILIGSKLYVPYILAYKSPPLISCAPPPKNQVHMLSKIPDPCISCRYSKLTTCCMIVGWWNLRGGADLVFQLCDWSVMI